jgi:type IV secretory pathway VirB10-like protein
VSNQASHNYLAFPPLESDRCPESGILPNQENTTTANTEEQANAEAAAATQPPKATKGAHVAPRKPRVAASKPKSGKKASPADRRAQSQKGAQRAKAASAREGSKTAKVLALLKRSGGVTLKELRKATGWQPHSVRGFLSGTLRKKMKLAVASAKDADGERRYSVKC